MLNLSAVPATVVCTTVYETSYTTVYDTILVPQVRKCIFTITMAPHNYSPDFSKTLRSKHLKSKSLYIEGAYSMFYLFF
jgi:hypothetical protein